MHSHTNRQWMGKFFKCGMRCWYCYKRLSLLPGEDIEIATKDHLIPTSRGGGNRIANIVPSCFACNQRKGDMTEEEFRRAFHTAFESLCGGEALFNEKTNFSMIDGPSLARLRKENESVSWAWRNPV